MSIIESRLAEIDELIEEAESEIESLKSQEQSVPLQIGCAFLGLFLMIVAVIALFMLLAKAFVGSWIFYLVLAAILGLSLARIRRKLKASSQVKELRNSRMEIEAGLTQLEAERNRLERLMTTLSAEEFGE
jgi:predicted membrane metal-binding protein